MCAERNSPDNVITNKTVANKVVTNKIATNKMVTYQKVSYYSTSPNPLNFPIRKSANLRNPRSVKCTPSTVPS